MGEICGMKYELQVLFHSFIITLYDNNEVIMNYNETLFIQYLLCRNSGKVGFIQKMWTVACTVHINELNSRRVGWIDSALKQIEQLRWLNPEIIKRYEYSVLI